MAARAALIAARSSCCGWGLLALKAAESSAAEAEAGGETTPTAPASAASIAARFRAGRPCRRSRPVPRRSGRRSGRPRRWPGPRGSLPGPRRPSWSRRSRRPSGRRRRSRRARTRRRRRARTRGRRGPRARPRCRSAARRAWGASEASTSRAGSETTATGLPATVMLFVEFLLGGVRGGEEEAEVRERRERSGCRNPGKEKGNEPRSALLLSRSLSFLSFSFKGPVKRTKGYKESQKKKKTHR